MDNNICDKRTELETLLTQAKNASASERTTALTELCHALIDQDPLIIEYYASQVKAASLINKGIFKEAVKAATKAKKNENVLLEKMKKPTDDELGANWLEKFPNTAYGLGDFFRYGDGFWYVKHEQEIKKEIREFIIDAKSENINPTNALLNSVLELAKPPIFVPAQKWNADPDWVVCENGTLQLSSRKLCDHNPDHYITNNLPFLYDPNATAPTLQKLLERLEEGIPEVSNFLQEYAGYCLTTDTNLEIALWFYGPPGNGKSTLILGFQTMLGSRAGLLGIAEIERSRFALSNLAGKTLVIATEQPRVRVGSTDILNAIISGEKISVEKKFKDPIDLIPRAKILWAMNELPRIDDPGNGLFRRVKIIPFPPLPMAQRDPQFKEKIKQEGAGILNWALDGLDRLKERRHFVFPEKVTEATDDFQMRNDTAAIFIKDRCEMDPNSELPAMKLYAAYDLWCFKNGHRPKSTTAVSYDWKRLGLTRLRSASGSIWRGLKIKGN
jgi:putative DNA primase/helicase